MRKPIAISIHARQAMSARRVSIDELLSTINNPEVTDRDAFGVVRYFKDKLCVVTKPDRRAIVVITVLLRDGDQWTNEQARRR